jgi:transcription antitermination factor NusG
MTDRRKSLEQGARRMNKTARSQMQDDGIVWYAVIVKSGKEFITHRIFNRVCEGVYMPMQRRWRRKNRYCRDKVKIAYAAIPGCMFIGFQQGRENWYTLFRKINSLRAVVGVAGRPVAVTGQCLADFLDRNKGNFDVADDEQFMRTYHEFKIGDRVQIVEGPFDGHVVEVQNINNGKAHILLDLFGVPQDVEIYLDKLEKAA